MNNAATRMVTNTNATVSVTASAGGTELVPALTGSKVRKTLIITNVSVTDVYIAIGFDPTSSVYNYKMATTTTIVLPAGIQEQIKALSGSGTVNVRVYEGT